MSGRRLHSTAPRQQRARTSAPPLQRAAHRGASRHEDYSYRVRPVHTDPVVGPIRVPQAVQCKLPMAYASEVVILESKEESPCLLDLTSETLLKFRNRQGTWQAEVRGADGDVLRTLL